MPFPNLPAARLDMAGDSAGIAQQVAHAKGLQGRILWIDGSANLGRINSVPQIHDIVAQARSAGFNVIVLDVKPIVGETLYPSKIASKLTEWKDEKMPASFDPLAAFIAEAHAAGLQLCANMAVFSEGHKYFSKGLGYTYPKMQTVLYEADRTVRAPVLYSPELTVSDTTNVLPTAPNTVAVYTDPTLLHHNVSGGLVTVTDFMGRIVAQIDGSYLADATVTAPVEGAVLVAQGPTAESLKSTTRVGDLLTFNSTPRYVPVADDSGQKVTLFVNPNDPGVQQHELDLLTEIVSNYDVDGVVFDDRLRFAGLNADFSDMSRAQFEQYVGHPIKWPDDVFRYNPFPNQDIIKGPEYQAWIVWRALTIRNWLARARAIVKYYRPHASLALYAGSWYGQYGDLGENWGADDYQGAFDFNTPAWRQTSLTSMLDWIATGCYYDVPTKMEGLLAGDAGATVEAGGQLSNQVVNDQTWTYAGLWALQFSDGTDRFAQALQAAAASTQGVMIFDLSQLYSNHLWSTITQAFAQPATAPHEVAGLIDDVRGKHQTGTPVAGEPAAGKAGTGL